MSARPAERVDRARRPGRRGALPTSGRAIALTVKSRFAQVLLDRRALERREVVDAAAAPVHDAPGAERLGELEHRARAARRRSSRAAASGSPSTAMSMSVTSRPRSSSRSAPPTIQDAAHRTCSRRTRGRRPRGDLVVDRARAAAPPPRRGSARRPGAPISTTSSPTSTSVSGAERHRHVVHADRAHERMAPAADQDVAVVRERAPPAVAVADRHGGDPGGLLRPPAAAVADALAPLEAAQRRHPGVQRQRRLEAVRRRVRLERVEPVDRDAAAHHVEVRRRVAERRGAVGGVHDAGRRGRPPPRSPGTPRAARRSGRRRARRRSRSASSGRPRSGAPASRSASSRSCVPSRPMPVSSFTCTRGAASATSSVHATTSASASIAMRSSSRVSAPITSTGTSMAGLPQLRGLGGGGHREPVAPPASAASGHGPEPWPYASP